MAENKMDISKVLAVLAQPREQLPPLENVERLYLNVRYMRKSGTVDDQRRVRVILPQGVERPMPLIYVPHYEMGEDAIELRDYLAQGWAVACPDAFQNEYNGHLTDDDLMFNNAALSLLRQRQEFDPDRIILVGGSAGAYMTLMLSGLQLGLCASIANGPITNVYFNFHEYFAKTNARNLQKLAQLAAEAKTEKKENTSEKQGDPLELLKRLQSLPVPFLAGLAGMFAPIGENFPEPDDFSRWEACSPVGLADRFSSPIMVNHCTSDVLVPVDQISKKYTYDKPGESLPENFFHRLPEDYPGKLGRSLEECLPAASTRTARFIVPESDEDTALPYDPTVQFNINIFDDGPVEGYGTHSSRMGGGRRLDVPYLTEMFRRTARETCVLTPGMLRGLLERYLGLSPALPVFPDAPEDVYGSRESYRQEAHETLHRWQQQHGEEALRKVFSQVLDNAGNDQERETLEKALRTVLD